MKGPSNQKADVVPVIDGLIKFNPANRLAQVASNLAKISVVCLAVWMLTGFTAVSRAAATLPVEQAVEGGGLAGFIRFVLHLDKELAKLIATYGKAIYAILFGIVFCETGRFAFRRQHHTIVSFDIIHGRLCRTLCLLANA